MQHDFPSAQTGKVADFVSGTIDLESQVIPYASFENTYELSTVLETMLIEWNMYLPKIVLFINSDAAQHSGWSNEKQKVNFAKELAKASNSTSMWIFTSGLNVGISKALGKEFHADFKKQYTELCYGANDDKITVNRTPLIGICHDALLTYSDEFHNPNTALKLENSGNKPDEGMYNLNAFHTHFLILKDSSLHKSGARTLLLQLDDVLTGISLRSEKLQNLLPPSPIPAIAILVQGDMTSVHFILAHLRKKLPVLVVKGSGGLADVLAHAYSEMSRSCHKLNDVDYFEHVWKLGVKDKIIAIFPHLKENRLILNVLCNSILDCIKLAEPPSMKHITVLNLHDVVCDTGDLPTQLLETLFKSQKSDTEDYHAELRVSLLLTIDFNCPELAKAQIFQSELAFQVDNDTFEKVLLMEGREEFVSLFLEFGFEIREYMNSERVLNLFQHTLTEDFFRQICWERILGYRQVCVLETWFIDSDINYLIRKLIGVDIYVNSQELNDFSTGHFGSLDCAEQAAKDIAQQKAIFLLTFWAVVTFRSKLALCLWRHTRYPMLTAFSISHAAEKMKKYCNESIVQDKLDDLKEQFKEMAYSIFDRCYEDTPLKAYKILSWKSKEFGGYSILDFAAILKHQKFVAHPCCQKWLTTKFMGTDSEETDVVIESSKSFSRTKENVILDPMKYTYPPLNKMIYYMWTAPITKFWISQIFYIIFLAVFSLAAMWTSCGSPYLDLIVCIWIVAIIFDLGYGLFTFKKVFRDISMFSSLLDITCMISFVISYILLRFVITDFPYLTKILICVGLLWFYYRMIFIYFPISESLGPLLYRVYLMVTVDFVNFMRLTTLIMIANGIAMQAILYPDHPLSLKMARKLLYKAFISFFFTPTGELRDTEKHCVPLAQKLHSDVVCRVSQYVDPSCSDGRTVVSYVIVFQYMILLKLILITILYALFSNTAGRLGVDSKTLWKSQRYTLVTRFVASLSIPAPLNVLYLFYFAFYCCLRVCTRRTFEEKKSLLDLAEYVSKEELDYFKQLLKRYHKDQKSKEKHERTLSEELKLIDDMTQDVMDKQQLINHANSRLLELAGYIERTQAIKASKHTDEIKSRDRRGVYLHVLSRESPYFKTAIQRYPVPDKYVPWEKVWPSYNPPIFSTPRSEFPEQLQQYVDNNVIFKKPKRIDHKKVTKYFWNEDSYSNGVYENRKSWMIDNNGSSFMYQIIDNLPINPIGRTGMKGKGSLPRWGPNHAVFVFIIKSQRTDGHASVSLPLDASYNVDYVEMFEKKWELSLPGGFVWGQCRYEVIQNLFKMSENSSPWITSDDMIAYFRDFAKSSDGSEVGFSDFSFERIHCGYMDDQSNTDQAWREVELWHIYYSVDTTLSDVFRDNLRWKPLTEDIFLSLPYGQTNLLQDTLRSLETNDSNI